MNDNEKTTLDDMSAEAAASKSKYSGSIVSDSNAKVGTAAKEGAVNAALTAKLDSASYSHLGLEKFSPEGKELIIQMLTEGTEVTKNTISDMLLYAIEMAPGSPVSVETGSMKQIQLFRSLQNSINNAGADFRIMFATILRIVYELKDTGAFQVRYAFRFFPDMNMNKEDRDAFTNLLHLMLTLCNPSGRAVAQRQIDLNKAISLGFTDEGRQRLISFFSI